LIFKRLRESLKWIDLTKSSPQAKLRIVDARITRLALCKRGKNGLKTLIKSDGTLEVQSLVKADKEARHLLAVVYAPDRVDHDGHTANAEVIQKMAHDFMRNGGQLDIEHDGKVLARTDAFPAESFIVQPGDPRFQSWEDYDGRPAGDLTGAWAVDICIENPALSKAYLEEGWNGVSLFGQAAVEQVSKSVAVDPEGTETMKPEELKAFLEGLQTALVKAVAEAVKPQEPQATDGKDKDDKKKGYPKFEGDPMDPKALEAFEKSLKAYEINEKIAAGKMTAADLAELRKSLAEDELSDEDAGITDDDSEEVKRLRRQLAKATRKGTNAPNASTKLEKSQVELDHEEGLEIAKMINEGRHAPSAGTGFTIVSK